MLTVVRNEVELRCTAGAIPQQIDVDLSGLEIGDTVHARLTRAVAIAVVPKGR